MFNHQAVRFIVHDERRDSRIYKAMVLFQCRQCAVVEKPAKEGSGLAPDAPIQALVPRKDETLRVYEG
jgi:hypothetical protein